MATERVLPAGFIEPEQGEFICTGCGYYVKQGEPFRHEDGCKFAKPRKTKKRDTSSTAPHAAGER